MNKKLLSLALSVFLVAAVSVTMAFEQFKPERSSGQSHLAAPDFSLKDTEGKTLRLRSQRGNPVAIFFGTSWCPACRTELPAFKNLYKKYADQGIRFFYININESTERTARFAKSNSLPFPALVDGDGRVAGSYHIIGVPTIFLIDQDGMFVKIAHRTSDLQAALDNVLSSKN